MNFPLSIHLRFWFRKWAIRLVRLFIQAAVRLKWGAAVFALMSFERRMGWPYHQP